MAKSSNRHFSPPQKMGQVSFAFWIKTKNHYSTSSIFQSVFPPMLEHVIFKLHACGSVAVFSKTNTQQRCECKMHNTLGLRKIFMVLNIFFCFSFVSWLKRTVWGREDVKQLLVLLQSDNTTALDV